eukprot:521725_1
MPLIAFEWFVLLIFAAECGVRFYSFGRSWFFTIDLHVTRVVLLIIVACDLMIACIYSGYSFRFSRFIRPVFPILFIRDLRRQYYIVLACIPYIIELIFLWMIICAIFARIGYHIFYHSEGHLSDGVTRKSVFMAHEFSLGLYPYDEKMSSYCTAALDDDSMKNCGDFLDGFVWVSFDTFFKACISLFGLLTSENFPEVWWPTWLSNDGHPYWSFFVAYALISIFFLMNLFSAAVYDAYQHIISKLDVIEEKRETQALKVAWICLDSGDSGSIGPKKFENLMYRLKPEYTEFEIGVLFKLLDPDNNHLVDAEDFSVMMINVLYLSISRKLHNKDDELKLYLQRLGRSCPFGYEILHAFQSQTWRYMMLIIQSVDILALLCYHQYYDEFNIVDFICILIILLELVLDVIFKHMSDLSKYFKSSRNRLYFGLTLIQTTGTFIGIFDDRNRLSALRFFGMFRVLNVAIFALEKIRFLRTALTRTLTQTVILLIPVFARICFHVLVVLLYVYAVIGTELFVDPSVETHGHSRCDPPLQTQSHPYALFCDAQMTIMTLIQILTTNNWHIIMYTAIQVTDNWFVSAYFITFFFLGPILVLSIVLAVFFNMFFGVAAQSEHELSAFFHETDTEAKKLQDHMELQEMQKHMEQDRPYEVPLPTECGISDLPNGHKILTIERDELVHIPLHQVAREIWEHIPGEDWLDDDTNNTFKQTFNGHEATQFLLDATFAQDQEEAVETLTVIMDEYGAFMRVDAGKKQEFENDANAHYQWIMVPEDEEENELNQMSDEEQEITNDEVALEDIMIGFRHSYGGYHRLLKQYRQAGIDPTQEAARATAARIPTTPNTIIDTPVDTPIDTPIDELVVKTINIIPPQPPPADAVDLHPPQPPPAAPTVDATKPPPDDTELPNTTVTTSLSAGNATKPPAMLTKSKSAKGTNLIGAKSKSRGGLQRTASSKNILLRHLDNKPRKGG